MNLTGLYLSRGTAGSTPGPITLVRQSFLGLSKFAEWAATDGYNLFVVAILAWGLGSSLFIVVRSWRNRGTESGSPERLFLARLICATVVGVMTTSALLFGYYTNGFLGSRLPLAVFPISACAGAVALDLVTALRLRLRSPKLTPMLMVACTAVAVLPIVATSVTQFRPTYAPELVRLLRTEYVGKPIVSQSWGPFYIFALTGGRTATIGAPPLEPTQMDRKLIEPLRNQAGELYYVCVTATFVWYTLPQGAEPCEFATARMAEAGHVLLNSGPGWSIMRVQPESVVGFSGSK
jgi:hypothetical protein